MLTVKPNSALVKMSFNLKYYKNLGGGGGGNLLTSHTVVLTLFLSVGNCFKGDKLALPLKSAYCYLVFACKFRVNMNRRS